MRYRCTRNIGGRWRISNLTEGFISFSSQLTLQARNPSQEMESAEALGAEVARELLKEGAKEILDEAKKANNAGK